MDASEVSSPPGSRSSPSTETIALVAHSAPNLWTQLFEANVWMRYSAWMTLHFGLGLLLRVVFRSQQDDYLGF